MKTIKNTKTIKFSILNFQFSILILLFTLLLSPLTSFAQGGTTGPLTWKIENKILTISGNGAMRDCDVKELPFPEVPAWVTDAPWGDYYKSFHAIVIEKGVTNIGRKAFFNCQMFDSIDIAGSVTKIGSNAFTYCNSLKSVVLPNGVTTLDELAFCDCGLVSITLPNTVYSIGIAAFIETPLTTVTNLNTVPITINSDVFEDINIGACTLKVPMGSVEAYKNAPVWKEFNIVGINVGIDEFEDPKSGGGEQLMVYPNPVTGACSITIPDEFLYETTLTLSIYDNLGKLVQQIQLNNEAEDFSFNITQKAKGIYNNNYLITRQKNKKNILSPGM